MKTIVATHNPDLARDFDRDLLRRCDLRLVMAHDTRELLERLRSSGGDLCFIDRMLPDGDGASALQALRSDKRLASIPAVLVSSAGAPASDRAQALQAGFSELVELPTAPGALSLLVGRLLGLPLREDERFSVRVHVFQPTGAAVAPQEVADSYLGSSIDLSEQGMLLKAKREVAVGTELGLRFTLPGRTGELNPRGRVVRVDARSFAPAYALALAFEDLSEVDRGALRDYLKMLVSERPFSWKIEQEGARRMISLTGVLRNESDLGPLLQLKGEVYFRMRDFRRVGSDSVQRWIELVRGLAGSTRISLVECPIAFVHQANLIPNLLDHQEVLSVYAPYACESCGLDEEKLIDVPTQLASTPIVPPRFACSACSAPLVFDDLPEQYFAFLQR